MKLLILTVILCAFAQQLTANVSFGGPPKGLMIFVSWWNQTGDTPAQLGDRLNYICANHRYGSGQNQTIKSLVLSEIAYPDPNASKYWVLSDKVIIPESLSIQALNINHHIPENFKNLYRNFQMSTKTHQPRTTSSRGPTWRRSYHSSRVEMERATLKRSISALSVWAVDPIAGCT